MRRDRLRRLGVVIATVAGMLSGCASQPRGPAASASFDATPVASALSATSVISGTVLASQRYGYRLVHPEGWTVSETPGAGGVHPDEPGVDTFNDLAGHILSVVGEPAPQLAGWTCAINRHLQVDHHLTADSVEDLVVAGVPAKLSSYHLVIEPYVTHYLTVELVHEGRGLTLSLESTTARDDEDRALLDSLLASFELTDGP